MTNEELVEKIQTGIDVTENMYQLYEQNSGMIYKIAKKYTYAEDISDLFQESYLALYKAAVKYKKDSGASFLTYMVISIDRQLNRYVAKSRLLRLPIHKHEQICKYMACKADFSNRQGREPTIKEIAHMMGLTVPQVETLLEYMDKGNITKSLDEKLGSDEDANSLYDLLVSEDTQLGEVLDNVANGELWEIAKRVLTPKEWEIIEMKYKKRCTIRTICEKLQKSYITVYNAEERAMSKLSHNGAVQSLAECMGIFHR
ncbi:sigma-70 family RNA polymerase sigma factor [Coprococcus eutactus]|nr:sigma-70 family RNA polymerase sigma factor [Coprococcus eutactus]